MHLLDLTLPEPAANLALDEALLLAAEEGGLSPVLRLWELQTYAVVLGAAGSLGIDVNEAACQADGVPILRRSSGGGTVVIGPGCLLYSVVLSYEFAPRLHEIVPSIRYVLGRMANALEPLVPGVKLEGISDLTLNGVKLSGNSQQRKRKHFLHHGTLLCGFDLEQISRYLNPPERQPEYRGDRAHREFVMNLHADVALVRERILGEWAPTSNYGPIPWEQMRALTLEKFGKEEWVRRR